MGILSEVKRVEMETQTNPVVCTPKEGKVFPGTWPDCPECHGNGHVHKDTPENPCQICQERSVGINRDLGSLIEFKYHGRPKNRINHFPHPGEVVVSAWRDITWAEVFNNSGIPYGTWPNCPNCKGLGLIRHEVGYDGLRPDRAWQKCGACQQKTRLFHIKNPNQKDMLLKQQATELKQISARHQTELEEIQSRHQAALDALPY